MYIINQSVTRLQLQSPLMAEGHRAHVRNGLPSGRAIRFSNDQSAVRFMRVVTENVSAGWIACSVEARTSCSISAIGRPLRDSIQVVSIAWPRNDGCAGRTKERIAWYRSGSRF